MKIFNSILFALLLNSCVSDNNSVTIVPPPIRESQPSWDKQEQNSGLITYIDNVGFLITPGAAERYSLLTEKFGNKLTPPVKKSEGLMPYENNFILTPEYMAIFMEISKLNKQ
jgi:hypothetical protein